MAFSQEELKQIGELIDEKNKALFEKIEDVRTHIGIVESSIQNLTVYLVTKDSVEGLEKINEVNKERKKGNFFSFLKKL